MHRGGSAGRVVGMSRRDPLRYFNSLLAFVPADE